MVVQAKDPYLDERLESVLDEPRQSKTERKPWKEDDYLMLSHYDGERWDESLVALSRSTG